MGILLLGPFEAVSRRPGVAPIPGSVLYLRKPDSWTFLEAVRMQSCAPWSPIVVLGEGGAELNQFRAFSGINPGSRIAMIDIQHPAFSEPGIFGALHQGGTLHALDFLDYLRRRLSSEAIHRIQDALSSDPVGSGTRRWLTRHHCGCAVYWRALFEFANHINRPGVFTMSRSQFSEMSGLSEKSVSLRCRRLLGLRFRMVRNFAAWEGLVERSLRFNRHVLEDIQPPSRRHPPQVPYDLTAILEQGEAAAGY